VPKQPGREKNSYAKRKTDQLNDSADETIPQLPTKTNFISLLPSCEKLGLAFREQRTWQNTPIKSQFQSHYSV